MPKTTASSYTPPQRSDIEVEVEQINMADYLVIAEERQKLIAEATKQDKTLE
jgi:hypothetical protein